MIDNLLHRACDEKPVTVKPWMQIRDANRKLDLPVECVARFFEWKKADFERRNYPFNPMLMADAFRKEAIGWIKKNAEWVDGCRRKRELERSRMGDVTQLESPEAPAKNKPSNPEPDLETLERMAAALDPQSREKMLRDIDEKRNALGAKR
jgi:hypothetical protein